MSVPKNITLLTGEYMFTIIYLVQNNRLGSVDMDNQQYPPDLQMLIDLHGHLCVGSAIGYRLSQYALRLLGKGAGLTVYSGGGGCPIDAIEILTGCTRVKGTLILTGQQGWGFYDTASEEGFLFTLKKELSRHNSADRESFIQALLALPDNEIFNVEPFESPAL